MLTKSLNEAGDDKERVKLRGEVVKAAENSKEQRREMECQASLGRSGMIDKPREKKR